MTAPLTEDLFARIEEHVPNCRYGCIACESAPDLLAEIRRLRGELAPANTWTDPNDGTTYDLTRTHRDDQGAYWRHAGWVGLPGEARTPLMHWSASSRPAPGGIRRMADLATLRAVIDDCGPLTVVTGDDEAEADR